MVGIFAEAQMGGPKYREIAEDLQRRIKSAEWSTDTPLPTEAELMEHYAASRNTIRDAVKWLTNRGLLLTRSGRGTYVVGKIEPFVVTMSADDAQSGPGGGEGAAYRAEVKVSGRDAADSPPRVEIQQADLDKARLLGIDERSLVVSRHQQRRIDGKPWSLQTSFYPYDFVQRGADALVNAADLTQGVVRYLEDTLGLVQVGYEDHITARPPDDEEIKFFRLSDNASVAVMQVNRVAFDESGRPMRLTVTTYPADRNELMYKMSTHVPKSALTGGSVDGASS
ncbi:GntR family transcriptional regulator [Nonomuraea sp. NPDC048916]|uniref:GntR family transcriptional regulator n=1 Tax=Nonomuraea sp. NPDC048916 TaxID=3154232 RepID=UPI003405237C